MKKAVVVTCAILALAVAGKVYADEHSHQHSGHMHEHTASTPAVEKAVTYHCPMHKDELSATPARCPKCGMNMAKMEGYDLKYRCPMHKDVTSDKPGKCEKCRMALEAVESRSPANRR